MKSKDEGGKTDSLETKSHQVKGIYKIETIYKSLDLIIFIPKCDRDDTLHSATFVSLAQGWYTTLHSPTFVSLAQGWYTTLTDFCFSSTQSFKSMLVGETLCQSKLHPSIWDIIYSGCKLCTENQWPGWENHPAQWN